MTKILHKYRKVMALALALLMVLTLVPQSAFTTVYAADDTSWQDGFTATEAVEGGSYYFDFSNMKETPNQFEMGLFSFNAGRANGAKYHSTNYGVEFKTGNALTFKVPGDCYVVVGGDNNNNCPNLTATASAENGFFDVDVQSTVKSSHCDLEATKAMSDLAVVYKYTGDAGTVTLTVDPDYTAGSYYKAYIVAAAVISIPKPVQVESKIDVVDFAAEQLDAATYNNLATVESFKSQIEEGKGGAIQSLAFNDADGNPFLSFSSAKGNNRLRTVNEDLKAVAHDQKSKVGDDGVTYNGYIYSNNSGAEDTYLALNLEENDIVTAMLGSNGNPAKYIFQAPDGSTQEFNFTNAAGVEKATFYASVKGEYKLYCSNEKLVCARVTRTHAKAVQYSGTAKFEDPKQTGKAAPTGYKINFVSKQSGAQTAVKVRSDGTYEVTLYAGYDYDLELLDANGYVIRDGASISVPADATTGNADVTVIPVDVKKATGNIVGLDADSLAKLELVLDSSNVYKPEFTANEGGTYSLSFEADVEYTVTANNVNDYTLKTTSFKASDDVTQDFVFEAKPTYPVTTTVTGVNDLSNAKVTYTNINEDNYSYTFGINDEAKLRDGQYTVKVSGVAKERVIQGATADVKVAGAGASTTAPFEPISNWDFSKLNSSADIEAIGDSYYYVGLKVGDAVAKNKIYLLANAGATVTIPDLKKGSKVKLSYCYCASFNAPGLESPVDEKSGSTSQIDSVEVTVPSDGDFVIEALAGTNAAQTYFTSIEVLDADKATPYKDTLTVGSGKDYETINAALAAIRTMERTADQKVTVMIDPGNYEEMLVIDTPNVTFKNAAENPSIELTNKGVDIDANAVRITSYYGHGYQYYSMGTDCKYDEDLLAVNKANGYCGFSNPGTGTTNGSYWNATVVITAGNFSADGIIFENSFNQYVSKKAANDVIEPIEGAAKEDASAPRASLEEGSTAVQHKEYVERAAALAIYDNVPNTYFDNCKFIGRQDTLYGGTGSTVAFEDSSIYGGTDYIFGPMIAVFKKCDLVFNTNDETSKGARDDIGYITAPQQRSGNGYLFDTCHVTSTIPGVDTASEHTSKPGELGRPWQSATSEAVFVNTVIDAADPFWVEQGMGESLIKPEGWLTSLGGESPFMEEYGTMEASGVDNSTGRASWATVSSEVPAKYNDVDFLAGWNPFHTEPTFHVNNSVVYTDNSATQYVSPSDDAKFVDEDGLAVNRGDVIADVIALDEAPNAEVKTAAEKIAAGEGMIQYYDANVYSLIKNDKMKAQLSAGTLAMRFDYPEGYDMNDNVVALHETKSVKVEKTEEGVLVYADGFSPYTLIFTKTSVEEPVPDDDNTEEVASAEDNSEPAAAETVLVRNVAPKTGDTSPVLPLSIALVLSGALALALTKKKRVR